MGSVITSFTGLRAVSPTGDFVIQASKVAKRFINVLGIESPGLTAAPAIAEYAVEILKSEGLNLNSKKSFNPIRPRVLRFNSMNAQQVKEAILKDPLYGNVVCRCETVTEGEVVDCIKRPAGASTVDGVKRRVRAGMGRCSGGFCAPKIIEILSRELGIPIENVTKSGEGSNYLVGKTK